jgi:glutamyl-tRNA(Gln) amidotransferase subunit D
MYSEKILDLIKKKNIDIGDKIKVITRDFSYSGILMPRNEVNIDNLVLKLENGYNIGINAEDIVSLELVEKIEKKEKERLEEEKTNLKGKIAILGVGGTIACRVDYRTGAVYPSISSEDLVLSFPKLKEKNIFVKNLFNIFSEDMTSEHWVKIAEEIYDEIKRGAKSVIILHGTDTMHYTSAALSFMLKTPVPIILVGSQRSSDRGSSDNYGNLMSSILVAESDIAEIGICMHGSINDDFCYFHRGTKVRKLHTSRRDAFKSVNDNPIAKIYWENEKIEIINKNYKRRDSEKLSLDKRINPNVCLIYIHPGIKKEIISSAKDYDGIVIAGTGLGHVPNYLIPEIKKISSEIPVVIAPQTIFGRINMNVYSSGRELLSAGVIGNLCDFTPEVALVKLMIALGRYKSLEEIKKFMETNIAGEITERSVVVWK